VIIAIFLIVIAVLLVVIFRWEYHSKIKDISRDDFGEEK